jgi:hypothetical protein
LEIAARYKSVVLDLYWKAHDLPAVVVVGRAGILYCLGQSLYSGIPPETTQNLRSFAKELAYNVGSFTWPGWDEAGIKPTSEDLAVGRECARLNLRLAIELGKPPSRVSMAHWLVGAHALAANDPDEAEKAFQLAQDVLPATDAASKSLERFNMGYLALARLCRNPSDAGLRANFEEIMTHLRARPDEDTEDYLTQLLTAHRVFTLCR